MNKRVLTLLITLCIVSSAAFYRNSNMDKILAAKAERAYKNNNIPLAQEYLEKTFELGSTSYKLRELYLNSIINSPFDEKSQAKLIKFLEYPIEDAAKLKAEYFLQDFKRNIYKKYPGNYIAQTVYNQQVMRWGRMPVTYKFLNIENVPDYFLKEIENAMTTWEIETDHQILFSREDSDADIIINFNAYNPANIQSGKYVVAYTTPELNLNKLKTMTIHFYLKDPSNEYYTPNQVYNTALHEIVHALGFMGHSDNINDVMYASKNSKCVINDERSSVTESDINTLKLLYKIKPDITNTSEITGDYTPYIVLGDEKQILDAKMKEAVTYVKNAPKLAGGYVDLAESFVANKDYKKAEKSLKKALRLADSREVQGLIYYNLGVVYFYTEEYDNALKYLTAAQNIKDSEDCHYLFAEIYAKTGNKQKAIQEYENLINKNPKNMEYVIGLTNLYIKNKNYLCARKTLKNFLKNNPEERNNKRLEPYGIVKMFL